MTSPLPPLPDSQSHVSRSGVPSIASMNAPFPPSASLSPLCPRSTHRSLVSHTSDQCLPRLRPHGLKKESQQRQEQELEYTPTPTPTPTKRHDQEIDIRQGQTQKHTSPSLDGTSPPRQADTLHQTIVEPSMQHQQHQHQHLQQHRYPRHQFPCTLTDSQEPYLISDRSSTLPCPQNDLIAARVYVPLSPDLGYLEAINAYFVLHPDDPSTAVDSFSENDSQTEDDDEEELQWNKHDSEAHKHDSDAYKHDSDAYKHDSYAYKHATHALVPQDYSRDIAKREWRRSRSVCGFSSSIETPPGSPKLNDGCSLISPATDGTLTTPPPSSRIIHTPKRRHSCVIPNTNEFRTVATIFGWVTPSTADDTPGNNSCRIEDIEQKSGCSSQHPSHMREAVCDTDNDSDMDASFQIGTKVERNTFCELSPVQDQGASDGSIELLQHTGEFRSSSSSERNATSSLAGQQVLLKSPVDRMSTTERYDYRKDTLSSCPSAVQAFSSSSWGQEKEKQSTSLNDIDFTEAGERPSRRQRPWPRSVDTFSSEDTQSTDRSKLDSASDATCKIDDNNDNSDNRALTSPLSRSQGTDSGYMSLSYNFLDLQFETLANDIAVSSCTAPGHEGTSLPLTITQTNQHSLNDSNDMAIRHEEPVRENSMNAPSTPSPLPQPPPPSSSVQPPPPPPPPPRYPEIDARVFDQVEGEGSDNNIFYAPMETSVLDSTSETYELRPIIAATIVKLIEKLTHQYGMNSGFISDFFLTYRLFMSPVQLCKYLIQRYLWALEQDTESRCVVRIRTFVVIRYWINNYFADDFSTSKSLRFQMASFLDAMRSNPHVQASARDSRIIRNLTQLFKYQRKHHRCLAKQSMAADEHNGNTDNDERRTAEVERLEVSTIHRHPEPAVIGLECGAVPRTVHPTTPVKGRHRASTLAGTTSCGSHMSSKPPLSRDSFVHSMSRQLSEGGAIIVRERRVSTSSIKSNRSGTNWSAKMTLGINKLRQKSEDIYQQFVHPISLSQKADNKSCVCWDPEYTGITEHHALNTTRSHPTMRPSVIITSTSREGSISQPFATHDATMGLSSNRPIRRFKSSLSLGQSSPTTMPSPAPSPTKNQFSSNSSRHSRSNSNSSMGYHPNPDCPYHVPCLVTMNREPGQKVQGLRDENDHATLQEALQDDFADLIAQAHSLLMSSTPATSLPPSPAWNYSPWHAASQYHHESASSSSAFSYKPFILFYRSQLIAQQLCLLEQHFLEQVRWDELLEMELTKAGRKIRFKNQSSASGCPFKAENERNGMEASNERSNMLCMWVASEVVSTHPIEDRVRVIEKFIRIAQKCYHYRNYNSLIQLVMGLGSSHLCGLRRTWARVSNFEMRVLQDLQDFISPCGNWSIIRKAMGKIDYQETLGENENAQRFSLQSLDSVNNSAKEFNTSGRNAANESSHSKLLHHQTPVDKQGCIPFLGLFVFDLTHIAVSPPWYLPPESSSSPGEIHILGGEPPASQSTTAPVAFSGLQEPDPMDIQELMSTGQLLVHFHRFQLIAKTIKWFTAFQRRPQKYTFPVDNTLYSKCFLLRVLSNEQVRELADNCEPE